MKAVNNLTISMGKPITASVLIPVKHTATPNCINQPFMVNGEPYRVTCLSFGTPHGVVLVDDITNVDVPTLGYLLGTHALFPKGASIVFVQVIDKNKLIARLWQKEEGEISFSLEAACVAVTAVIQLQKILTHEADVTMGNYDFHIKWDRGNNTVYLTGLAALVQAPLNVQVSV